MIIPGKRRPLSRVTLFSIALLGALAVIFLVGEQQGFDRAMRRALFILVLAAALWMMDAVPAYAVGILVIALQIFLLGRPGGVYAETPQDWEQFAVILGHPLIWLFFGGFVLAAGMSKTGLDRKLASRVLLRLGDRPGRILLGVMGITFLLSMFMSNTATTAMMLALLAPLLASLEKGDRFVPGLLMAVAVAANLGGMGSLIGTPPNAIAVGALAEDPDINISFLSWMIIGLPPALLMTYLAYRLILVFYPSESERIDVSAWQSPTFTAASTEVPPAVEDARGGEQAEEAPVVSPSADGGEMPDEALENAPIEAETESGGIQDDSSAETATEPDPQEPGVPVWQIRVMVFTLAATILLWLTGQWHGAPTAVVSFLPITLLTVTGILTVSDIRGLPYDVLFLIAGGLALGNMVTDTGLAEWLVDGLPLEGVGVFALGLGMAFLCVILSNFMSNTAAANILVPLGITVAAGMEAQAVVPIALGASAAMCLPIATPPNALVYATDRVRTVDFIRMGLIVGIIVPLVGTAWAQLVFAVVPGF